MATADNKENGRHDESTSDYDDDKEEERQEQQEDGAPLVLQRYQLLGPHKLGAERDDYNQRGVDTQTGQRVAIKLFERKEEAIHTASTFQALVGEDHTNLIGYHGFDPDYAFPGRWQGERFQGALVLEAAEQSLDDVSKYRHPPPHDCIE